MLTTGVKTGKRGAKGGERAMRSGVGIFHGWPPTRPGTLTSPALVSQKLLHLKCQPLQSPSPLHLQHNRIAPLDLLQGRAERAQGIDRYLVYAVDNIS